MKLVTCSIAALTLALPVICIAQDHTTRGITLTGVVQDLNGAPLNGAEIISSADVRAVTNREGQFTLSNVPPGSDVLVRRIGYQPQSFAVRTEPDVTGVSVRVSLAPTAVSLGTMVIEGKRVDRQLWENGFYKRERAGSGVFFSPERLEHTAASVGTLMNEVPSLRLDRTRGNSTALARSPDGMSYCKMNVFLDGVYLRWATDAGLDNVIPRDEVKAIEVYNRADMVPNVIKGLAGAQAGSPYAGTRNGGSIGDGYKECGAILIWSKSSLTTGKPETK